MTANFFIGVCSVGVALNRERADTHIKEWLEVRLGQGDFLLPLFGVCTALRVNRGRPGLAVEVAKYLV